MGLGRFNMTVGGNHITTSDVVRVLGVLLTPNLSLEKHVTSLSTKCFFQLRQLRHIWHSLDDDSIAAPVHTFVSTRVDYCISLLADTAKKTTNKLQCILNAVRVVIEPQQVQPRSDSVPAPDFTLARRRQPDPVQAVCTSVTVNFKLSVKWLKNFSIFHFKCNVSTW